MNWKLPPQAQQWVERIDALSLRERGLVFAAVLGVLYFLAATLVFPPLERERARLAAELAGKQRELTALNTQIADLIALKGGDQAGQARTRLRDLEAQLRTDGVAARSVVSPREMARLVEQVLAQQGGLEAVRVENLPPVPLTESGAAAGPKPAAAAPATQTATGVFRHTLRVEVRGRYPDLLRYLRALEQLSWKVYWGEATLTAETYPYSRMVLLLYTLSLDETWMAL